MCARRIEPSDPWEQKPDPDASTDAAVQGFSSEPAGFWTRHPLDALVAGCAAPRTMRGPAIEMADDPLRDSPLLELPPPRDMDRSDSDKAAPAPVRLKVAGSAPRKIKIPIRKDR